jgi:hypothetical protein
VTARLLLGVLRLSFDLDFEPAQAAVDICEFQAKVFSELIDALAHDDGLLFVKFHKSFAVWWHRSAEAPPHADLFL